jgi:hypothetical protein
MRESSLRPGECAACGTALSRALVREVRHYELTRLLEVTCASCERTFLAIEIDGREPNAIEVEDVAQAATALARAETLSDLFDPSDLPDAA